MSAKKYGLLTKASYAAAKHPTTSSQQVPVKKNIFGDSSSDDEVAIRKPKTSGSNFSQLKLAQKLQDEALAEDSTIFQYDEVYEEIENKRKEELNAKKTTEAKKPKYINKLLEAAGKRKVENERRVERKVQKEREAEGEEFADKEQFVTSSYRKKLEEMKKVDEEEERETRIENLTDVTKQKDLSGFYRHIYSQKMDTNEDELSKPADDATKKKNYRKRKSSEDEEAENPAEGTSAHLPCNLDADSDFNIDSSDSEDEKDKENVKVKIENEEKLSEPATEITSAEPEKVEPATVKKEEEIEEPPEPPKPKIDIWKKRTVGEVYDLALQKYYERKALKESQRG